MAETLVEEYRGGVLDNIHQGYICGVAEGGKVEYAVGDENHVTFLRSSAKPLQAIPVLLHKVDEIFGLTEKEATLFTASHRGESFHIEAIESILKKTNLSEDNLYCCPVYPANMDARDHLIREGNFKRRVYHNCSGKHLGFMALSKVIGVSSDQYWEPNHPVQQLILQYMSVISGYPQDQIQIGIDGCGVPVFALPIRYLANAYLRMACPDLIEDREVREVVTKIGSLMNQNYEMVTGTNFICSTILEDPNIVAKGGAKGVYCFGLKEERLGFSLKVIDGSEEEWPLIIASILEQINYKNQRTIDRLYTLASKMIKNDNHTIVGENRVVFSLRRGGEYRNISKDNRKEKV